MGRRYIVAVAVAAITSLCAACRFDASPSPGFLCMEQPICPGDLVCVDGYCVEEVAVADAMSPMDDAPAIDASCEGGTISPPADSCSVESVDITADAHCPGGVVLEGDTTDYVNDLGSAATTCLSQATGGKDASYKLTLGAGEQITARVTATWDTALYLSNGCTTGATCPDSGGVNELSASGEELVYTADETTAGVLWLFVDTTGVESGTYTLEVEIQ